MNLFQKLMFIFLLFAVPNIGTTAPVEDRDMKAALIYNFSVYTSWPDNSLNTFNVCMFEEDMENINASLLESKKINGKQVNFRVIRELSEVKICQVLFMQDVKLSRLSKLNNIPQTATLTIVEASDTSNFSGMINIKTENNKYVFSINNQAAKQANLLLSSKLLRLAEKVN